MLINRSIFECVIIKNSINFILLYFIDPYTSQFNPILNHKLITN